MKRIILLILLNLIAFPKAHGIDYLVTSQRSDDVPGSLRRILRVACAQPGDDVVRFDPRAGPQFRIVVSVPFQIRENCNGKIHLLGPGVEDSQEVQLIVNDSERFRHSTDCDPSEEDCLYPVGDPGAGYFHGDSCILHIYSNSNTIRNITFLGNAYGAGVCAFGRDNRIENNRFGQEPWYCS